MPSRKGIFPVVEREPDHVDRIQEQWARERPDLDTSPQGLIGRTHRLADRLMDELLVVYRRHGLGQGEFDVLATLRRAGDPFELTPSALAQTTMVTSGAVTKRLDRLEAAGLVRRQPNDLDGRGRVVGLTEAGRRLIDQAYTEHMKNEHRLVAGLDADERAQLEHLLRRWAASLDA